MIANEKRSEIIATLCNNTKASANLVTKQSALLLEKRMGSLNEELSGYVNIVQERTQLLLARIEEIEQANALKTYSLMDSEEFLDSSHYILNELLSRTVIIIGFSEVISLDYADTLNDSQNKIIEQINKLGKALVSTFNDFGDKLRD
ncbi:MAG: hypothetical protein GY927_10410 [bacterium]|nr:hypothetical protein [bacterium]